MHKWLDKYDIADPEHVDALETSAAVQEFSHKMPRAEAEKKAHRDYTRERLIESAAHHLSGAKAAQGAGDMENARKHSAMYQMALKSLGHPEIGEVPSEILNHAKNQPSKLYSFKPHSSDMFLGGIEKSEDLAKGDVIQFPGKFNQPSDKPVDSPEREGQLLAMPTRHGKLLHSDGKGLRVFDYSHHLPAGSNERLTVWDGPDPKKFAAILNDESGNTLGLVHPDGKSSLSHHNLVDKHKGAMMAALAQHKREMLGKPISKSIKEKVVDILKRKIYES